MTTLRWFSTIAFVFLLISCSDESSETQVEETILMEGGKFRSYRMGYGPDRVQEGEKWSPAFVSDTLIEYEKDVYFLEDSLSLFVFLAFDELGLFEIQADLYGGSRRHLQTIDSSFAQSLTQSYGAADTIGQERRWTTFSQKNNTVEITLSREIDASGQRFVSLNYLEPLDDEY